jgi:hypothetical protein
MAIPFSTARTLKGTPPPPHYCSPLPSPIRSRHTPWLVARRPADHALTPPCKNYCNVSTWCSMRPHWTRDVRSSQRLYLNQDNIAYESVLLDYAPVKPHFSEITALIFFLHICAETVINVKYFSERMVHLRVILNKMSSNGFTYVKNQFCKAEKKFHGHIMASHVYINPEQVLTPDILHLKPTDNSAVFLVSNLRHLRYLRTTL